MNIETTTDAAMLKKMRGAVICQMVRSSDNLTELEDLALEKFKIELRLAELTGEELVSDVVTDIIKCQAGFPK